MFARSFAGNASGKGLAFTLLAGLNLMVLAVGYGGCGGAREMA